MSRRADPSHSRRLVICSNIQVPVCSRQGVGWTASPNKELKLTKPGTIGASQLNSSVRRTGWRNGSGAHGVQARVTSEREPDVQFDLRFSIVTISPLEPALLVSLVIASVCTWFLGKGLGNLTRRVEDPWRRRLYLGPVWVLASVVYFFLPNVLVDFAYPALHPEDRDAMVCVAMVWPTFFVPTGIGVVSALRALHAGAPLGAATTRA